MEEGLQDILSTDSRGRSEPSKSREHVLHDTPREEGSADGNAGVPSAYEMIESVLGVRRRLYEMYIRCTKSCGRVE